MSTPDEPIRFVEILTTASAVANFHGEQDVQPAHVLSAIRILRNEIALEDLGRPVSPLIPRRGTPGSTPEVRAFAQHWMELLENDVHRELTSEQLEAIVAELQNLRGNP